MPGHLTVGDGLALMGVSLGLGIGLGFGLGFGALGKGIQRGLCHIGDSIQSLGRRGADRRRTPGAPDAAQQQQDVSVRT